MWGVIQRTEPPDSPAKGSGRFVLPTGCPPSLPVPSGVTPRPHARPWLFKWGDRHLFAHGRGSAGLLKGDHPEVSAQRAPCAISAEITAHCWLPGNILDQHRCGSRGEFSRPGCPAAPGGVGGQTQGTERSGGRKKYITTNKKEKIN